jgi:nitroimidazol reductase NimA-like FMN-containing flavoprotein (pyridoxamine 5'-phosphate oxidase superfamily)
MAHLTALPPEECMSLLASVPFGRVVFTRRALPAIRPVNHLVDGGDVILRTHLGSDTVVAYEADALDPGTRTGWSVVITGIARLVTDPDDRSRYHALLHPWVDGPHDSVVRISPGLVTGYTVG